MNKPQDNSRPSWWSRAQQIMSALVALSGDAVKVADALRRIFG
jgi:hypothetical protein